MIVKFFHKSIWVLLLIPIYLLGGNVEEILNKISPNERASLERLFTFFIRWEQLGHVLFFENKAVNFSAIPISCDFSLTHIATTKNPEPFQKQLALDWEVWKKYEQLLLTNHNFIVCEEIRTIRHDEKSATVIDVFFVNKRSLLKCLHQNIELFKKALGRNFSPETFLKQIEMEKKLRPLINNDEMLLGILLGFGHEASSNFKNELPSETVREKPQGVQLAPVSFKGNPESDESKRLVEIYSEEIKAIWSRYQDKDWLVVTLQALFQEN